MIREAELTYIKKRVHELYWNEDLNCARALLKNRGRAFLMKKIERSFALVFAGLAVKLAIPEK